MWSASRPRVRSTATAAARGFTICFGFAYTVVACSPRPSSTPVRSKIVPRLPGSVTVSRCWVCPSRASDSARTPCNHVARRKRPPNASVSTASISLIRRLTTRFTVRARLVRQRHVGGLIRRRLDEPQPFRGEALDARRRRLARELRRQRSVLRPELGTLATEPVELHVQPQDRDVRRHDTGEQCGDDRDPNDAAGYAPLPLYHPRCVPHRRRLRPLGFCSPGGHSDFDSHTHPRR